MSTRSTTHFQDSGSDAAIVYRHSDGYPEGAGTDLLRFIDECSKLEDSRLTDPSYLAAKYVVFLADMFNHKYVQRNGKYQYVRAKSKLDFISVGIVMEDPMDIEYRYTVECSGSKKGRDMVVCHPVSCSYPDNVWTTKKAVAIPGPPEGVGQPQL